MAPDRSKIVSLYDKYECGKVYSCTMRGSFRVPYVTNPIKVRKINSMEGEKVE